MRRTQPLETTEFELDAETRLIVPTPAEILRVKAYLIVQRNYVRDYLDVVALSDAMGIDEAVHVLRKLDDYYDDRSGEHGSVLTALVAALADPMPRDTDVIPELPRYKALEPRWHEWSAIVESCQDLALRLAGAR